MAKTAKVYARQLQYILENDWLDAVIQLSTDQFMNTGISTYIWVLSKDKPDYRAGKDGQSRRSSSLV